MNKLNFDDLVNSIVTEAPISSFLSKVGQTARTIGKGLGTAARVGGATVGAVAGAAAAGLEAPGKIVRAAKDIAFEPGGIARGLRKVQKKMPTFKGKEKPQVGTERKGPIEFDKKVVQTLLANQAAAASASKTTQGQQATGQTTSTTIQAPGTVTGGTAVPGTAGGTSSTATTSPITTLQKQTAALSQRPPRVGDVFNVVGPYGRLIKYKINNVSDNSVEATKLV